MWSQVYDPFGNMLVYMDKHYAPPLYLEAKDRTEEILNQAGFLRDIYANDRAAAATLDRALDETKDESGIGRARLLAARAEIAVAMGDRELASKLEDRVARIHLPEADLRSYEEELRAPRHLRNWAGIEPGE